MTILELGGILLHCPRLVRNMHIIEALSDFDLAPNEAHVYVELLSMGLTTAGPIIDATKLHRQLVYNALDRLDSLGLATVQRKNNRKHFEQLFHYH